MFFTPAALTRFHAYPLSSAPCPPGACSFLVLAYFETDVIPPFKHRRCINKMGASDIPIALYAVHFNLFRSSKSRDGQENISDSISFPDLCRFAPNVNGSTDRDQGRLHLNASDDARYNRVFGLISSRRPESKRSGTVTPSTVQVVTSVCSRKRVDHAGNTGTSAPPHTPLPIPQNALMGPLIWSIRRFVEGDPSFLPYSLYDTHVCLGQALVGILEPPNSERCSTALISWGRADYAEWGEFAPHTMFTPLQRDDILELGMGCLIPPLTAFVVWPGHGWIATKYRR